MIRTGEEYRAGLRDGREVWIDGERVPDVTVHPAFKPVVDLKARMYEMTHEPACAEIRRFSESYAYVTCSPVRLSTCDVILPLFWVAEKLYVMLNVPEWMLVNCPITL
jgi:hypothetical protein